MAEATKDAQEGDNQGYVFYMLTTFEHAILYCKPVIMCIIVLAEDLELLVHLSFNHEK